MDKQELVNQIIAIRIAKFEPHQVTAAERAALEKLTVPALEANLKQLRDNVLKRQQPPQDQDVYRDYYLAQIFRIPVPGFGLPIRNQASEKMILSWINPGEIMDREFLVKVIAENPSLASKLQWQSADAFNPEKLKQAAAKQLAQDKKEFEAAVKSLRSFGYTEANFNLTRQVLGEGFNKYDIQNAIGSNALQLSPPSQSESDQWAVEDIEASNQQLLNATDSELRVRVRDESVARQQQTAQEQADRQLQAYAAIDEAIGFPKLPDTWNGEELDVAFFRKCDVATQKFITRKFGIYQVNARIQGRG